MHLHLLHPEFLEDALDRSIELEWLARPLCIRTNPSRGRVNVYEHERTAMERLDLPHFNTSAWRAMGHSPATEEAKVFGGKRGTRLLRQRLAALSRAACRNQLALVTRSVRLKYRLAPKPMLGEGETCTGTQSPFYRFALTSPPLPAQRPLFAFNVRAKSILNRSPISIRAKVKAVEPADYKNRITRC